MPFPALRPLLVPFLLVPLAAAVTTACAEDDPLTTTAVTQETAAPAAGADGDATGADCVDGPVPEDLEAMPPVEGIDRPDEIVDLRGQARVEVPIRDNVFEVRWFRVDPCTEIVFVNRGANRHNVVAVADDAFPKISEDLLDAGPQTLLVARPGDYPFYCSLHGAPGRGQSGYFVVGDG